MNIGIYKKLITILFIGFLSTFNGEIKSEEICYYSTPKEYKKCLKKGLSKIEPLFPVETGNERYAIWEGTLTNSQLIDSYNYTILKIKAPNKNDILITKSINKFTSWYGLDWRFNNPITNLISSKDIISWQLKYVYELGLFNLKIHNYIVDIKYLDELGDKKRLIARGKKTHTELLGNLLKVMSDLDQGEILDVNNLLTKKLYRNEKKLFIISSIINDGIRQNKNCLIVKDIKFPELVNEYKMIFKTINPLKAKLDLPTSSDLKPICN